jgi:hypothetical protein
MGLQVVKGNHQRQTAKCSAEGFGGDIINYLIMTDDDDG